MNRGGEGMGKCWCRGLKICGRIPRGHGHRRVMRHVLSLWGRLVLGMRLHGHSRIPIYVILVVWVLSAQYKILAK